MSQSGLSFGAYCPEGGIWYACETSRVAFTGCCVSNACGETTGCPKADIRPATFNKTWYGNFENQDCYAGEFYTCAYTNPPFLGCCSVAPCGTGCPRESLEQMLMIGDDFVKPGPMSISRDPEGLVGLSTMTSAPAATSTAFASGSSGSSLSTGAIVGIVVGGVAALVAVLVFAWFLLRRRKQAAKEDPSPSYPPPTYSAHQSPAQSQDAKWGSPAMAQTMSMSPGMSQKGSDRFSSTTGTNTYYGPGSPDMGYAHDPRTSMASAAMSPPMMHHQGTWDNISPATPMHTGHSYSHSGPVMSELDTTENTPALAELSNTEQAPAPKPLKKGSN